jgi:hypothetical protein
MLYTLFRLNHKVLNANVRFSNNNITHDETNVKVLMYIIHNYLTENEFCHIIYKVDK